MSTLVRYLAGACCIVAFLAAVACTGAATPSPQPTSVSPPPSKAAVTPAVENAQWKAEWDKLAAAATREGRVVVSGAPGASYPEAAKAFQKAYPSIQVEFSGATGTNAVIKITAERDGGEHLWDVYINGVDTFFTMRDKGYLEPIRPALILPEVLDTSQWSGGYDDSWMDKEGQYVFQFERRLTFAAYVNRDVVPEAELSKVEQLLDPKWKGKMVLQDPREIGVARTILGYFLQVKGEDWLRRLLAQDLTIMQDGRSQAEALVRGRYPIAVGVASAELALLRQQGLGANVKPLDPQGSDSVFVTGGFGSVGLISKAPHPNAAKMFANWLLSQEGQAAYVKTTNLNSRRVDVTGGSEELAMQAGVKYLYANKEDFQPTIRRAGEIAKEMIR